MFCNGVVEVFGGTDDVVFPVPVFVPVLSVTVDLPGSSGESFLQLVKSVAAITNDNKHPLKREFRVIVCIISRFCFQM